MTLRNSDGCPLNGPICRVRRWPLTSDTQDEREQQEAHAGRGPGVLVATEPAVGADDDPDDRRDRDPEDQPDELDLGQADVVAEPVLRDEVLWQPLHEEQRDPAEEPHDREQDLVRSPAGQHERQVAAGQRREVDDQGLWVVQGETAGEPAAQRHAADDERERDDAQQPRLGPPPPGPDRTDASRARRRGCGRAVVAPAVMSAAARAGTGPRRSGARPRRRWSRHPPRAGR